MKNIFLICFLFINTGLQAQSANFKTIINQYEKLDTAYYLNDIKEIIINSKDDYIVRCYDDIINNMENNKLVFVLKIDIDTNKISTNNYIKVDTCKLKYDIYI